MVFVAVFVMRNDRKEWFAWCELLNDILILGSCIVCYQKWSWQEIVFFLIALCYPNFHYVMCKLCSAYGINSFKQSYMQ